ncbi:glycine zipper family protein [Wolbachia endosymbiont of Tribolium confusum]|uniref:glycine zipper family protein n=1 Tax=Wolbachia endosymbiont of Tribolium confusum TaxID=214474 RepID=UPI001CF52B36|nr:glycine zipper family protein [Wolbachia endosymbiont of Tribolium confusum]MCA7010531.1 glycine zipper family protein [Wolbachia endosymbiont of Tribolium confusum]
MVQGGAVNPTNSDELIENVVEYISKKKDLLQKLQGLLTLRGFERKSEIFDESDIDSMSKFLIENKDILGSVIGLILEDIEKNKIESKEFLEQVDKVKGMEEKLEALGNQLLAQGVISGAAVTTLTGVLAGLLTVGGVTGALIGGGAAFVGFVALVAIAAIGYLIYQNRGEIKEGAIECGKAVKSFVKDVIDKLPTIQAKKNNFKKLISNLMEKNLEADEGERTTLSNEIKIIKMLQNKEQLMAIKELVKNGKIQDFSEINKLLEKGFSTHESDEKALKEFMEKFQPAIMAIGNNKIEEVEKKVNEKVEEMKPSSERVSEEGKGVN